MPRHAARSVGAIAVAVAVTVALSSTTAGAAVGRDDPTNARWLPPVASPTVVRGFEAPEHAYAAGHRGVDLRSGADEVVVAPALGVVAFAGPVAGRSVITIDHGDGFVSSLEPVDAVVAVGASVAVGEPVGVLSPEGHVGPGTVHFGVRHRGEYVNPLLLVGGFERAVLLPCC
ncbi:M23 family metallopeptidase [Microbacterium oleivorans]|uniref:M23 family metallopeptidase n=1 Tax=Microbacterium oleivorans TaxID=273677 RepID=A0A7D5EW62_9MICO|nr:M23 family metallopeptidase [Microbacterium oleivorans]QLD10368.1 M23 family metallopeptidase [Microbacterium oleivorans]